MIADPELLYLDGNSLGRLPVGTRRALERADRRVGRGARHRLARLDRPARRASATRWPPACSARGPARCWSPTRPRSTSTSSRARRSTPTLSAQRALVTDTDNFPTDRYVLEGIAAAARAAAAAVRLGRPAARAAGVRPRAAAGGRRRRADRAQPRQLPLRRDRRHEGADRRSRAATTRTSSGISRTRPARCRCGCARPASSWPSAAPTSTSTPAPAGPAYLYVARGAAGGPAHADLGLVRPGASSSRWSGRTSRWRASGASSPARRRSSASPPSRRAWRSRRRPASTRSARSRSRRPS